MTARTSPDPAASGRATLRVAIVDDRTLLVSGLGAALGAYRHIEVVAPDALPAGGCVLLGQRSEPYAPPVGVRVVHLTTHRSVADLVRTLRHESTSMRRPKQGRALSDREQTILALTADGASAADIAEHLGVSARTVERYRSAVTEKLAVRSTSHAVAVGARADDADRAG